MSGAGLGAMTMQAMTRHHLDDVLAIEHASSPQPWTEGILADELAHADTRTYRVVLADDVVVGFAGVLVQVGEAHIVNIAVDPAHRRRGVARCLLVELMRLAAARGATAATLEVRASNAGAQRLYHRFGFAPAGVRPGYYADGEGAVIMWADDIDSDGYAERLRRLDTDYPDVTTDTGTSAP